MVRASPIPYGGEIYGQMKNVARVNKQLIKQIPCIITADCEVLAGFMNGKVAQVKLRKQLIINEP